MKLLVADDDPVSLRVLDGTLASWGYEVETATDGEAAWRALRAVDPPPLSILNWMMPKMDGTEVCRHVRDSQTVRPSYPILLTSRSRKKDLVNGLQSGADDYLTKPFDPDELRARLQVGERVLGLQSELAARVDDLERALSEVRRLKGLLPICSYCKKIRDAHRWREIESYVAEYSDAQLSHTICPDCYERHVGPLLSNGPG